MPQVVAAVVAFWAVYGTAITLTLTAISVGYSVYASAQARRQAKKGFRDGIAQMVRSSVESHKVVYGQAMVSGPVAFWGTTGPKNEFLHIVVPLAGHEVEEIGEVYFNDRPASEYGKYAPLKEVRVDFPTTAGGSVTLAGVVYSGSHTAMASAINAAGVYDAWAHVWGTNQDEQGNFYDPRYALSIRAKTGNDDFTVTSTGGTVSLVRATTILYRIKKHLGSPDQTADPDLVAEVPEWTTDHRLRGIAYLYVRLRWNQEAFPNGIPNIKALVKGKKVLDPRTGTTAWSDNWALCVRDYLSASYGLGCQDDEIHGASAIASANISDETVSLPGGGSQKRYTCNGVIDTAGAPLENLEELRTGGGGDIVYIQGRWRIHAGAYMQPVAPLNESHLRGGLKIRPRPPRKDLFNAVKGVFADPGQFYQPVDYPPVTSQFYVDQDGGESSTIDLDLPFTNDPYAAQRIAKLYLERARQPITVEYPATYAALELCGYDNVTLSIDRMGWSGKVFKVIHWALAEEGGVDLVLQEEAAGSYAWNSGEATTIDYAPDIQLARPQDIGAVTGLALQSGTAQLLVSGDGTIISRVMCAWNEPETGGFIIGYDFEYRRSAETEWTAQRTNETRAFIAPARDRDLYDVRVRAVNSIGARGPYAYAHNHRVVGKTEPPPRPDTFLVCRQPDGTREFTWALNDSPPDLEGFRIRYRLGLGWLWNQMTPLHTGVLVSSPFESNALAAGEYTFAIKSVDTTGNESTDALYIVTTLGSPRIAGAIDVQDPKAQGWPGTKTNCWRDPNDGNLYAADQETWADKATWAAWTQWAPNPYQTITYEHPTVDLGAITAFTPLVTVTGHGTQTIEEQHSDDGTNWSAWAPAGTLVTGRYSRIRITMYAATGLASITSAQIIWSADLVEEDIEDLDTSTLAVESGGGFRLPLQKQFATIRRVELALQNVGGLASWEIVDKSTSGPHVRIRNASATLIYPVIDAYVKGL